MKRTAGYCPEELAIQDDSGWTFEIEDYIISASSIDSERDFEEQEGITVMGSYFVS
jgi:hypothetical protein